LRRLPSHHTLCFLWSTCASHQRDARVVPKKEGPTTGGNDMLAHRSGMRRREARKSTQKLAPSRSFVPPSPSSYLLAECVAAVSGPPRATTRPAPTVRRRSSCSTRSTLTSRGLRATCSASGRAQKQLVHLIGTRNRDQRDWSPPRQKPISTSPVPSFHYHSLTGESPCGRARRDSSPPQVRHPAPWSSPRRVEPLQAQH
jgi:hypothetical protein